MRPVIPIRWSLPACWSKSALQLCYVLLLLLTTIQSHTLVQKKNSKNLAPNVNAYDPDVECDYGQKTLHQTAHIHYVFQRFESPVRPFSPWNYHALTMIVSTRERNHRRSPRLRRVPRRW
ncbi:hypothetical protein H4582DRAFT_2025067 [Lactarius indigo]|nr:hypothetical protein H4582DRAFT_2025067 [Lactarius indigo]